MAKTFNLEEYDPKSVDSRIKSGVSFLAQNFASIALAFSAAIIVATTWLNIELQEFFNIRFATDAILTMVLYCTVQLAMQSKGEKNGQLESEYVSERDKYLAIREKIIALGSPRIEEFCATNVAESLKRRRMALLARFVKGLSYDEWFDKFSDKNYKELKTYARKHRHRKDMGFIPLRKQVPFIWKCNQLRSKILTPELMILDDPENWTNDAIAPSPRTVLRKKSRGELVVSVFSAIFVVSLLFTLVASPTWESFLFALAKIFFLIVRAVKGYSVGSLAYSVHGVTYHVSQRAKCEEYLTWIERTAAEGEKREMYSQEAVKTATPSLEINS